MDIYNNYMNIHDGIRNTFVESEFIAQANSYSALYGHLLPKAREARILDIGCGNGMFLFFLKRLGYTNYFGIDADEQSINFIHKYITEKAMFSDVFSFIGNESCEYDYIFMNEVLEHIPTDKLILLVQTIYKCLKPGGLFVCLVPNMENPVTTYTRWHDFTHTIGFTRNSVKMLLRRGGFEQITVFPAEYQYKNITLITRIKQVFKKALTKVVKKLLIAFFQYPVEGIAFHKRIYAVAKKG